MRNDDSHAAAFTPIQLLEVEISHPVPAISAHDAATGRRSERALSLVRLHAQPLGVVETAPGAEGLTAEDHARQIWRALRTEIRAHLRADELPEPDTLDARGLPAATLPRCERERAAALAGAPLVSVVVATRDRPASLATCLRSLQALRYPRYEIVVVDNAPSSDVAACVVGHVQGAAPVRYLREDRPGLARAHNRALGDARGEILAFTDDDVVVDRLWLAELVRGFSLAERVGCVTGLIVPLELQTPAQLWIEHYGGFGKGFAQRIFDLSMHRPRSPLYPYAAGMFGSGANMAFSAEALRRIGGFDPALGAGSVARGGDDLAAFFDVISAGYRLVYQPAAIVHHPHRREYAGLRTQLYGYGVALTAYLTRIVIDDPSRIPALAARAPRGLAYAFGARSAKNAAKRPDYPRELTLLEWQGMLYGPLAYLRSRRAARIAGGQRGAARAWPRPVPAEPGEERTRR